MNNSDSGVLAVSFGIVLAYTTVWVGQNAVQDQLMNPFLSGGLAPLSIGTVLLMTMVGSVLILATGLEVIDKIAEPQLLGRAEYTLVGGAGLIGASAGILWTIYGWLFRIEAGSGLLSGVSTESIIALVAVAGPTVYGFYCLWRPQKGPSQRNIDRKSPELDPEFVRKATTQWSNPDNRRAVRRRSQPPESQSEQSEPDGEAKDRRNDRSSPDQGVNFTEMEFRWVTETDVDFDDVGGMQELKDELYRDVITPLTTNSDEAEQLGVTAPNILLYGPPGCGKTYLVNALATELGVPFVQLSGADIQSKWINESASKVQMLFEEARRVAEQTGGAVVFLDELDSVLKARSSGVNSHEEDTKVVNEFLNWLEETGEYNIVFIGATNRLESLDDAGIRSGRIDRKLRVGEPDRPTRKKILTAQLADRPHTLTEDQFEQIAAWTNDWTAADLDQFVNEAARTALSRGANEITWLDVKHVFAETV